MTWSAANEHAFGADALSPVHVCLGNRQAVVSYSERTRLVRTEVGGYVSTNNVGNPNAALIVHRVRPEVRAVPAQECTRQDLGRSSPP